MLRIIKNLKKSALAIVFVVILLFIQAYSDLSLPAYTSDIVNVGILQGGIDSQVPQAIRASMLKRILIAMDEDSQVVFFNHYSLPDKNTLSQKKWDKYLDKYPLLSEQSIYIWDGKNEEEIKEIITDPILLFVTQTIPSLAPHPPEKPMENNPFDYISQMPETLKSQIITQFIKAEYEAIGVNLNRLQSQYIMLVGIKMIALALIAMIASILVTFVSSKIAARMGRDLRSNVFSKVLSFSNKEMDHFSTASLITRSTNDIHQIQMSVIMIIRIVIYSPILALGGIFKILNTDSEMTWTLGVGVGAVMFVVLSLLIIAMPRFKLMQKLVDKVNLVLREILTGLPVIRAFSNEKHEDKRFDLVNTDLTKNSLFIGRIMTFLMPTLMLIMNLVSLLIIWVGADRINAGTMQAGDMMAFIQYTMQIIMSFLMLTMVSIILPRAAVSANRINEVLLEDPQIHDPKQAKSMDPYKKGFLEFKKVHFRYPNAEEDVLSDISFEARPGEFTAIIGSTGSGKSTLANLIPRFYDVTAGEILLNGIDIRSITQKDLRERLGYVPQKGVLFTGTIESNIGFGVKDASPEIIEKAARIAQAEDFIKEKPDGYNAPISQGGTNVSGGQKQRLSIARAVARDPEIYVFDDSFSALDYKTDSELRKALKQKLSHSTVIIIAQRINTIINADQIIVLDAGKIVGKGKHKELLKECEVYNQIASSQLSKEELTYE